VGQVGNQRGRATRDRILAAGDRCFEEHGLSLTLEQVAEAAGTTRMTVHRHTGGREQFVTHLVLRASNRLAAELRAILEGPDPAAGPPTDPSVERLTDALVHTVGAIRGTPALARLFRGADVAGPWSELDPDERVLGTIRHFYRPYLVAIEAEGALRADVTADEAVAWLLAQVLLVLVVPSVAAGPDDVTRFFAHLAVPAVLRAAP
jgi:AcrR family transcriptional regulator